MTTNGFSKSVAVKGAVKKPGTFKSPGDISITTALYELAGGTAVKPFKFAVVGGSTGTFVDEWSFGKKLSEFDVAEPVVMAFDIGSCVVNVVRILTVYNYQKHGNIANLKKLVKALDELIDADGRVSFDAFKELLAKAEESAQSETEKRVLNPIKSAMAIFGVEFEEHADMKYCKASNCDTMYRTPCANACPSDVDLPGTFALLQKGKYVESVALGRNDNPFLLTCGRVCEDLPCQKYCQRQIIDTPVYTRSLHKYAGVKAAEVAGSLEAALDYPALRPKTKTDKKIAVVGAGPSGLSAAYFLARYGHSVTVYERMSVPGGMMRVGIPDYRLPAEVLNAEVDHICKMGVEIKYNQEMGKDFSLKDLQKDYDAVFVGIGAFKAFTLNIPGDENVVTAVDFLYKGNLGIKIPELGKSVLVVGGGNVAVDCARIAWRLGSEDVTMSCREEHHRMPATIDEIHHTEEEGIKIINCVNPCEIRKEGDKFVVKFQKLTPRKEGEWDWLWTEDYFELTVDTIVTAIGQFADVEMLAAQGMEIDRRVLKADKHTFATPMEGVFGGGDCVLSPRTAVEAIGTGKRAADTIHKYLIPGAKTGFRSMRGLFSNYVGPYSSEPAEQQLSAVAKAADRRNFKEAEAPYTDLQAELEMKRCICSAKTGVRRMGI